MAEAFQNSAFQSSAFQAEAPASGPAFQADAFQNNAFQATIPALNAALDATEAQDSASFSLAQPTPEILPGKTQRAESRQEWPPPYIAPAHARLKATEAQDAASFKARFDNTDDEIIMALMMAAWDEDAVGGRR